MNDTPPSMLVGITTCNRANVLRKAITSALHQDYPNLAVAVLDDGSIDDTPLIAKEFPTVCWDRHESPKGYMQGRNRLMAESDATYYVSLDDDAWFLKGDEIRRAVEFMETNPSAAAVAFDILSPNQPTAKPRGEPTPTRSFIGCGHLLRLSAVREAGFYASCPGSYGSEERDLCLRLLDRDCAVFLLPGVHVWHDKAWNGRDWYPLHKSGVCNDLAMAARRCPFPDVLAVVPYKILSHLRFGWKKRELLRPALAGIGMFCVHFSQIIKSRKAVRRCIFKQ